ncbi:MAG: PilZ domain-containing protein [Acidobacteriota bacterium]
MAQIEDFVLEQNILNIPVKVKGIDFDKWEWEEKTDIVSVSRNSRGIILSRKCQIGHLLCLESDFNAESESVAGNYGAIWGIVQHCTLISAKNSVEKFNVGLALIGENPPDDYFENPTQYYRICGIGKDGFWKIEQTEVEFIPRKHPRFLVSIEVFLGILDDSSNLGKGEKVLTENISFGGAAVFSDLALNKGDCVKFISAQYEFSALAVVRNITKIPNNKQKIHLEFIAGKFPVEKAVK